MQVFYFIAAIVSCSQFALATSTVEVKPDSPRSSLSHCGQSCTLEYSIVHVSWAPSVSTIYAHGNSKQLAWTSSAYSDYFAQYASSIVVGTTIRDYFEPAFTAECCSEAWYISHGVTANFQIEPTRVASIPQNATITGTGVVCEETQALYTGDAIATAQGSAPLKLSFLEHDCEIHTTVIQSIITQVTIVAASGNLPTGTAIGQSTFWDADSDEITIFLPPTPTPFFTISPCSFSNWASCKFSVGSLDLRWEATTITISGNSSELARLEEAIATSIEEHYDWVNGTAGPWDSAFSVTETCCGTSVLLDTVVTIDYGGWCPTTVLTGYTSVLPQDIGNRFVDGRLADCINWAGGLPTTKTAVFIAKVTAGEGPIDSTTPAATATRVPDEIPTETSKSSRLPSTTKASESVRTGSTSRQQTRPPSNPTPRPPSNPNPPAPSASTPRPPSNPNPPAPSASTPRSLAPNPSPSNEAELPATQGRDDNEPRPTMQTIIFTSLISGTPVIVTTAIPVSVTGQPIDVPVPQPQSVIFSTSPVIFTTTNSAGSEIIVSTFTAVPIGTGVGVTFRNSQGSLVTSQETQFLEASTTSGQTGVQLPNPTHTSELVTKSHTTIFTVYSRQGTSLISETITSVVGDQAETLPPFAGAGFRTNIPIYTLIIMGFVAITFAISF